MKASGIASHECQMCHSQGPDTTDEVYHEVQSMTFGHRYVAYVLEKAKGRSPEIAIPVFFVQHEIDELEFLDRRNDVRCRGKERGEIGDKSWYSFFPVGRDDGYRAKKKTLTRNSPRATYEGARFDGGNFPVIAFLNVAKKAKGQFEEFEW